ncbi:hypothetical protein PPL_08051a, partial [Heterostelium album PN500]
MKLVAIVIPIDVFAVAALPGASINEPDLSSIRWFSKQYQLGWSLTEIDCNLIPQLVCNTVGNEQNVSMIFLNSPYKAVPQGTPPIIQKLAFQNIARIVFTGYYPAVDPSQNIFQLINIPENKNLELLSNFQNSIFNSDIPQSLFDSSVLFQMPGCTNFPNMQQIELTLSQPVDVNIQEFPGQAIKLKSTPSRYKNEIRSNLSFESGYGIYLLDIDNFNINPNDFRLSSLSTITLRKSSGISVARYLEHYQEFNSDPSTYPVYSWFAANSTIEIHNNTHLVGPVHDYPSEGFYPITLNLADNPNISELPESFCYLEDIDLTGTALTTVPDCFYCKWSFFKNRFSVKIPTDFVCVPRLDKTLFVYNPINPNPINMHIFGKNLGWDQIANLTMVTANSHFIYNNNNATKGSFSFFVNTTKLTFEWAYDISIVNAAFGIIEGTSLRVEINGTFNTTMDYLVVINGVSCSPADIYPNVLICTLSSIPTIRNPIVTVTNEIQSINTTLKIQNIPIVVSTSKLYESGGNLTLYGYFHDNIIQANVTVNNVNCTITKANSTVIVCIITTNLTPGFANLSVFTNNIEFISSYLVIYPLDIPNNCIVDNSTCSSNGICINNKCVCNSGFGGYYCQSTLTPTVIIQPNTTSPNVNVISNNTQFQFNIIAIQELDDLRDVFSSYHFNVSNWNYSKSSDIEKDNYKYVLNDSSVQFKTEVNIDNFKVYKNLTFAGIETIYPPNSLKLSITISGWSFNSNLNTLRVLFATEMKYQTIDDKCQSEIRDKQQFDQLHNLQYLTITKDGVTYFGRFLDYVLSDNRPAYSLNEII